MNARIMDVGTFVILGNAVLLGFRHGFDWDHIAAISDIVGTAGATSLNSDGTIAFSSPQAIRLSSLYAVGHAAVVFILGILALQFAKILPEWIDPIMERAVGQTLLMLGAWIICSILNQGTERNLSMKSRWMVVSEWLRFGRKENEHYPSKSARGYNAFSSFGIGAIHGIGAETGTQVLVIAAIGGATNIAMGISILCSFICGLLISNTVVALVACAGFLSSARFKPVMVSLSIVTGIFSLVIGSIFLAGHGDLLPSLGH